MDKQKLLEYKKTDLQKGCQRWWDVTEHTPQDDRFYFCYSSIYGSYYEGRYNPVMGWRDTDGDRLLTVTHWLDFEIYKPFPIRNRLDEDEAEKYGLKVKENHYGNKYLD